MQENDEITVSDDAVIDIFDTLSPLKRAMLLKKSKKKAKKNLMKQGYDASLASRLVKNATKRIASNKPTKKSVGRGR